MISWIRPRGMSVFVFHSVESSAPSDRSWVTSAQRFKDQLDYIVDNFDVRPISDALQTLGCKTTRKPQACITFDDGDPSWAGLVRSELAQRQLKATFYVATDQIQSQPIWHDRLSYCLAAIHLPQLDLPWLGVRDLPYQSEEERSHAAEAIGQLFKYQSPAVRNRMLELLERDSGVRCPAGGLTAQDLLALAHDGHEIGSHTRSHPILSHCSDDVAYREISESREILCAIIGAPVTAFSYPNGKPGRDYLSRHVNMVRKAGYSNAVSTAHGGFHWGSSVWEIPRFTPWGRTPSSMRRQIFINSWSNPLQVQRRLTMKPRVLVVENGTGFGGAVVALGNLLQSLKSERCSIGIVSGQDYQLDRHPCVEMTITASSHTSRFRRVLQGIELQAWWIPATLRRMFVARLDDILVRLPYLVKLLLIAIRFRPNVIHGNNELVSNREALLVAAMLSIPYVQHVRGPIPQNVRLDYLTRRPVVYLPVSRWLNFECIDRGIEVPRLIQIYDGVSDAADNSSRLCSFARAASITDNSRRLIVAMVGMLVPWKGQHLFVEAVAKVCREHPRATFLIVGAQPALVESNYHRSLVDRVKELGLEQVVLFTGQISSLAQKMSEFDVVVSASTAPEPLGLVMIEALRNGCYFIGPDHGATSEFIDGAQRGLLFKHGNSESLAQALNDALSGPHVWQRSERLASGANLALETSLETHAERIMAVYEGLIPIASGSAPIIS